MILTCPNCGTQYVVKDGAIPPQGRQVRCASCKHSWHQDPEESAELELGPEAEASAEAELPEAEAEAETRVAEASEVEADRAETGPESFAEAAMIEPSTGPEAEERAYEEATLQGARSEEAAPQGARVEELISRTSPGEVSADYGAPPEPEIQEDDEFSPFAARDELEPRRRKPIVTLLLLLVVVAALAAAFWFFAPAEWKSRIGLTQITTPLQLSNPPQMELRQLASGNQLLTVAGRVINPTAEAHPVPPIYAQLYDHGGKVIYRWTIAPPTPTLGPGASASFNSAEVNVPAGAEGLTISLGPPKA
jgi:predicted Zn finger-like uncharacterized protein